MLTHAKSRANRTLQRISNTLKSREPFDRETRITDRRLLMSPHVFLRLTKEHRQKKKGTTNALRVLCLSHAPKHRSVESKQFRQIGRPTKSTSYEFLFSSFFLFLGVSFFLSFSFRKIVSTLALDVRTRRKYRCEYAGDRGTILINQIDEKTIILI